MLPVSGDNPVTHRWRLLLLSGIATAIAVAAILVTLVALYGVGFEQQRERLIETAHSQARLIEAIADFNARYSEQDVPGGAFAATMTQIRTAHGRFQGFGETGEFTLAKRDGDQIVFLLQHRHTNLSDSASVPFASDLAAPMQRALSGKSGTLVGRDYRGVDVLAAYEPVLPLGLGIVAKIDLAEVRAPYIRAGLLSGGVSLVIIIMGVWAFQRIGNPLIRRLEQNERRYRTVFESSSDALVLIGETLEQCNPPACRLFGVDSKDIVGGTLADVSPPTQPDGLGSAQEIRARTLDAMSGVAQAFHWQCLHKDGSLIETEVTMNALEVDDRQLVLTSLRDVTAEREAEREREQLVLELRARNAEMERFTYTVSHDLKSPLITIQGFLGLLQRDMEHEDAERVKEDVERIGSATKTMGRLLEELLNLSRVGRIVNPPEEATFDVLAQEAKERVGGEISRCGAQVDIVRQGGTIIGDRARLVDVLQNLISNAVKFMGQQADPRVEIGIRKANGEEVYYVRDNGSGIDPAYHEKIFGLFDKLDAGTEGSGVGLALVKQIIDVHGGSVWVESEGKGQGACFCFTMPRGSENISAAR